MIVRMWRGKVRKELKSEYVAYLNQTGLADYGKVEGNQGVYLLCQDMGDNVEFLTMTFWSSIAAYLLNFSENAEHFEVLDGGAKASR